MMNRQSIQHRLSKALNIALVASVAVAVTSCNSAREAELENYIANVKDRPTKPIPPIPAIKPYLRYVYPEHDIDPFDVSILAPVISPVSEVQRADTGIQIDTSRVPEFLENYPLDSLKMVGTLNKEGQLWALIKVPDGGIQRVKKGHYMGKNFGKIDGISETKITLQEVVPNGFGGYKPRENAISISHLD